MEECKLGQAGPSVSRFGLGLAALGRPGYINLGHADDLQRSYGVDAMRDHAHQVLDAAWEAGVRYFDAARSYGRAEEFLSSWISKRQISPDTVTIGSKWGYTYTADWNVNLPNGKKHEVKDHSLSVLNRQFDESTTLLGSQLDIYQIHSATEESGVLANDAVLARLSELRDSGFTIGFSVSGPQQADTIRRGLEIERAGKPVFGCVQATWNLLEQSAGLALTEAHAEGRGVIVKEALANGRLTSRNRDDAFRQQHAKLFELADDLDTTIDAIAIGCALRQPWASTVLSGAAAVEHLESNLCGVDITTNSLLDRVMDAPDSPDEYWTIRSKLPWN